jgi:flavin-dependent dehydrogenase
LSVEATSEAEIADAVVIGGGPAGSGVARLLALWGYDVVVLPGRGRARMPLAESLPPSCRKPLAALGALEAVERAGFVETRGNTSAWERPELRTLDFGEPSGFQVQRDRFDRLLLGLASDAGARVIDGGVAVEVRPSGEVPTTTLSTLRWRSAAGTGALRARWLLDCSGRAGVIARRGSRTPIDAPPTLALVGIWSRPGGWDLPDESHTVVEAYDQGWVWSVPVGEGRRYVAAMVDPRCSDLSRGGGLQAMYDAEIRRTTHLRRALEGATLEVGPSACVATPYASARYGGDGHLLVGDAGSFLDPLSSFGVKKALASARLAATVVHTVMRSSAMASAALDLFEERERAAQAAYGELARRYYALAAERFDTPFWSARAGSGRRTGSAGITPGAPTADSLRAEWSAGGLLDPSPGALPITHADHRLHRAVGRLRITSPLRLRAAGHLHLVQRPTVFGREIVLEDRLSAPALPAAVRFHRGVDLPLLLRIAAEADEFPDLFDAYQRAAPPVALPDFLSAVAGLLALDLVECAG